MAVAAKFFYWLDNNMLSNLTAFMRAQHSIGTFPLHPLMLQPSCIQLLNLHRTNDHSFINKLTKNNVAAASNIVGGMHSINCLLFSSNIVLDCNDIIANSKTHGQYSSMWTNVVFENNLVRTSCCNGFVSMLEMPSMDATLYTLPRYAQLEQIAFLCSFVHPYQNLQCKTRSPGYLG